MWSIRKWWRFCSSHQLGGLPAEADGTPHKCSRLHGHNYEVELELAADVLDLVGMVRDYGELAVFGRWLDEQLDHRHLNEVLEGNRLWWGSATWSPHWRNPTAERLAEFLFRVARDELGLAQVVAVSVRETGSTWAQYRPAPSALTAPDGSTDPGLLRDELLRLSRQVAELRDRLAGQVAELHNRIGPSGVSAEGSAGADR
jgi:6-pyruvoyltetrahydropterin/6-carboxytetrahydropterin synthase